MNTWRFAMLLLLLSVAGCSPWGVMGDAETRPDGMSAGGETTGAFTPSDEVIECAYFVAPDGDDGTSGSVDEPWGSLQHALEVARPGEVVCLRGGRYALEDAVYIERSGTTEQPIVIIAYPGEEPILDGQGLASSLIILHQGASHLRISGLALRNFTDWGMDLEGENRFVQLDHLVIGGGEAGIHLTYGSDELAPPEGGPVEYIIIEDTLVFDSEFTAIDCTPGPCNHITIRRTEIFGSGIRGEASFGADGIAISRGYPILIEDCRVHDNGGDGIDLNSRDREGHAQGVIVRRNLVAGNYQNGIKLWAGGRIENNLLWGQGNSALWLGTFDGELEVINNTIAYNMWDGGTSGRNWAFSAGYPEEIVARPEVSLLLVNNIFAFNTGPEVGSPTGIFLGPGVSLTEHHNLYFSRADGEITAEYLDWEVSQEEIATGTWNERTGQGQGDLTADPGFLAGWPDVNLTPVDHSPATDAGDETHCPAQDVYGRARPVDGDGDGEAGCDLGAIEVGAEAGSSSGSLGPHATRLGGVKTWLYLIDVDLDEETLGQMVDANFDMVVLDYIPSEANNTDFPMASVVERLHAAAHPKLVLAYIDVGQAEDYRTYWQPGWEVGDPEWILATDPDGWEGNYPVAFWREAYRQIWLEPSGYLDGILTAGFDGVYLDWIEAYSDEDVIDFAEEENVNSQLEMIQWVGDIADHTRSRNPAFILIAQNAAELASVDAYSEHIDGIAQEQIWFDGGADGDPPGDCPLPATREDVDTEAYYDSLPAECQRQYVDYPDSTLHISSEEYLDYLKAARAKGLVIFTVDYAADPTNIAAAYRQSRALGFVPFVGTRALDQFIEPVE